MILLLLAGAVAGWWAGRVIYSIFFSELRNIPSPPVFQLFPLYYKYILVRGNGPFVIHDYHERYGRVIRVGWNTVLFTDTKAAATIYGNYQFAKGAMYEGFNFFGENIISFRAREMHATRKRLLSPAYTKPSLALVEERLREVGVRGIVAGLTAAIAHGGEINLYDLIRYTLWDMTSDISLGSSLGMLQGKNRQVIAWVAHLLKYGILCAMFPVANRFIPQCLTELGRLQEGLVKDYVARRADAGGNYVGVRNLDRFYEQLEAGSLSYAEVYAEAHIMLIAGTDTTTNSLASFMYLLLKHPPVYARLVDEIGGVPAAGEFLTYPEVKDLVYLDAALKEALRLLPVASIPLLRETPKGGREICGHFIPEATEVAVPLYSLHRSEALWEGAAQYRPERWIDAAGAPIRHDNFLPFSMGPRGCIGKELAYMQMKLVAANLLRRFHLALQAPAEEIPYGAIPAFQPIHCRIIVTARPRPQ